MRHFMKGMSVMKQLKLLLCLVLFGGTILTGTSCTKKSKTQQEINLGMTQNKVQTILGKADKVNENTWYYYDAKIVQKEKSYYHSINQNDSNKANEILDDLKSMTYSYTLIRFNEENNVKEVFVDKKHHYSLDNEYESVQKELKNVNLSANLINYYLKGVDQKKTIVDGSLDTLTYHATFTDGSSMKNYLDLENCILQFDSLAHLTWSDAICNYESSVKAENVGQLDENQRLTSWKQKGKVVLPEDTLEIVDHLFENRNDVSSIILPKSLKKIGNDAFLNCSQLHAVYFNGTLKDWLGIQFSNATSNPMNCKANFFIGNELVQSIEIPDTINELNYTFNGCLSLEEVTLNQSVLKIGKDTFAHCENIKKVNYVGTNITIADWNAITFENASSNPLHSGADLYFNDELVSEIEIDSTMTTLNAYAFMGCTSLTQVTFKENSQLQAIRTSAFENCRSLIHFQLPDTINTIEANAFAGCQKLVLNEYENSLYLGNEIHPYLVLVSAKNMNISTTSIHFDTFMILDNAFKSCSKLTRIEISEKIQFIGNEAFAHCISLKEVSFSNDSQLVKLENSTFYHCSALENIVLPHSIVDIGTSAFAYCEQLKTIQISDQLKCIQTTAFAWCTHLTSITIPATTTTIGAHAFYQCQSLTILCATSSALESWDSDWNSSDCPVQYQA